LQKTVKGMKEPVLKPLHRRTAPVKLPTRTLVSPEEDAKENQTTVGSQVDKKQRKETTYPEKHNLKGMLSTFRPNTKGDIFPGLISPEPSLEKNLRGGENFALTHTTKREKGKGERNDRRIAERRRGETSIRV